VYLSPSIWASHSVALQIHGDAAEEVRHTEQLQHAVKDVVKSNKTLKLLAIILKGNDHAPGAMAGAANALAQTMQEQRVRRKAVTYVPGATGWADDGLRSQSLEDIAALIVAKADGRLKRQLEQSGMPASAHSFIKQWASMFVRALLSPLLSKVHSDA
jgi:hypothetical protein